MESTDSQLIADALRGNDTAFATLLNRHLSGVYKFAYRYVRNADDAEDIAQEAFVRVWKNLKKFDQAKNFKTWLFTIAKNAALDIIKKKRPLLFSQLEREEESLDMVLAPYLAGPELPDVIFERALLKAELAEALNALPAGYRTVLAMRYHDHLKFREIAESLNEPIDTVKSKHRRGLILLKKVVDGRPTALA